MVVWRTNFMADEKQVAKIIAGVVGAGIVGASIVALINEIYNDLSAYISNDEYSNVDYDDEDDENVTITDGVIELDRIQQDPEFACEDDNTAIFEKREIRNDIEYAQREFDRQSQKNSVEYLYIDFTQNLKPGSRNRNDVYLEPLEDQFEKVRRKLALHGKNEITDFRKFVSLCFPSIKSV